MLNPDALDAVPAYGSGLNPTDCVKVTERCRAERNHAFKLKICFGADTDQPNLEALRAGVQQGKGLFVDANQCWDPAKAQARLPILFDNVVEWFEELMIDNESAAHWRTLPSKCPIALAGGKTSSIIKTWRDASTGSPSSSRIPANGAAVMVV